VVLVPFIDEQRLLTHVDAVDPAKFSPAERRRNKLGVVRRAWSGFRDPYNSKRGFSRVVTIQRQPH
jgi:hypothetical protein